MNRVRVLLAIALLFTALLLFAYFGTSILAGPISFLYGRTPGFETVSSIAQIAAVLAGIGFLVTSAFVVIPTALKPASWGRKLLYVLPAYLLGVLGVGVLMNLFGIGTVGMLQGVPLLSEFSYATGWLAVSAVLATIGIVIAAWRAQLPGQIVKLAMQSLSVTGILSLVATVAMLISVFIVATNQPTFPNFGPNGPGGPPSGQGAPQGQATRTAPRTPGAQGGGVQQGGGEQQGGGGQQGRGGPEGGGGPGGGPGGGLAGLISRYEMGGALMAIFAAVALVSTVMGVQALRAGGAAMAGEAAAPLNVGQQIVPVAVSAIIITVVGFLLIQVFQVSHENPPVQTTLSFDTPEGKQLFEGACSDCHSNNTVWPWYSYIAPSSWLQASHVNTARSFFNTSEWNTIPAFRKRQIIGNVAMQVRSHNMPPLDYRMIHSTAQLTDQQRETLIQDLQAALQKQQ